MFVIGFCTALCSRRSAPPSAGSAPCSVQSSESGRGTPAAAAVSPPRRILAGRASAARTARVSRAMRLPEVGRVWTDREAGVVERLHSLRPANTHRREHLPTTCEPPVHMRQSRLGWPRLVKCGRRRTVPEGLKDLAALAVTFILTAWVSRAAVVPATARLLHFAEVCEESRELARLRRGRGREHGGKGDGGRASAGAGAAH